MLLDHPVDCGSKDPKDNLTFSFFKNAKQCGEHLESVGLQRLPATVVLLDFIPSLA
jgi:hypothetical protein